MGSFDLALVRLLFGGSAESEELRAQDLLIADDAEQWGRHDVAAELRGRHRPRMFLSLHTAMPTTETNQCWCEAVYPGYARVELKPGKEYAFPQCTGGDVPIHPPPLWIARAFGVGLAPSGPGELVICGEINPNIPLGNGVTPILIPNVDIT